MSGPGTTGAGPTSGPSGTSWLDWRLPETAGRRALSLEERAATAFTLIALLNLPGIIVAPWGGPPSWLLNLTSVGATISISALLLVAARAIRSRRLWAVVLIRPLLVVIVAFGLYAVVVAAGQGWIKVPVDAALATWAWLGRPETPEVRRALATSAAKVKLADAGAAATGARGAPTEPGVEAGRPAIARAAVVAVAVAVLQAAIWYGPPIFGWGGLLDVHQPDFAATLRVACPKAGGPPAALAVTYDWSWRSSAVLPSGLDMVVIGWRGSDRAGRPLYLLGATPDSGPGIQDGLQAFPDVDLAEQVESGLPASWHWGILLDRQAMAPGEIQLQLQLGQASPAQPEPVTVTATYIHLGLWTQAAVPVTCAW